jgi:hypothetical protein
MHAGSARVRGSERKLALLREAFQKILVLRSSIHQYGNETLPRSHPWWRRGNLWIQAILDKSIMALATPSR